MNRLLRLVGIGSAPAGVLEQEHVPRAAPGSARGALGPPARSWLMVRVPRLAPSESAAGAGKRRDGAPIGATCPKGRVTQKDCRADRRAVPLAFEKRGPRNKARARFAPRERSNLPKMNEFRGGRFAGLLRSAGAA